MKLLKEQLILIVMLLVSSTVLSGASPALEAGFVQPPNSVRPWVYWFWINGNISKEGITADLEAMQRVGIGGVLIMEVDPGLPAGPVSFASAQWLELFRFACEEAKRLGLEVNFNNDAGWAGSAGPWITPELSMQKVVWTETEIHGPRHFEEVLPEPKRVAGYYRDIAVLAFPTPLDDTYRIADIDLKASFISKSSPYGSKMGIPSLPITFAELPIEKKIDRSQILNLTAKMKNGILSWDVPEGNWTVLRFGHTSTGKDNHPTPESGRGLECDKLSKAAIEVHFAAFLEKILAEVGPLAGQTLVSTHIDSWESDSQNWTPLFREEFQKRNGYDLLPFLPVLTGRVLGGLEISERFLWDFRKAISDLLNDNYAGRLRQLANQHGLRLSIEAYDNTPGDDMSYAGRADEPQAEFWFGRDYFPGVYRSWEWCAGAVSAAHVYGKPIVAAEAFTSMPGENWLAHPASIKSLGDWAFCEGINRFIFHRYAMQPWKDRKPGMTMGAWGLHYERTQTWWEQTKPWHEYVARCQ
ncbi:MAG: Alpha-L-arabinofuranosidase precursor [Pedosphaera sp.]|nr:Alpha-L-arabinofuranosidase precursor [Pedosphaera sp.]